ncbi:hypothetical protein D9M72_286980 [compost metagenome]
MQDALERGGAIAQLLHLVARALQRAQQQRRNVASVFHQQDAAHGACGPVQKDVPIWNWKRCVRSAAMPLAVSSFW